MESVSLADVANSIQNGMGYLINLIKNEIYLWFNAPIENTIIFIIFTWLIFYVPSKTTQWLFQKYLKWKFKDKFLEGDERKKYDKVERMEETIIMIFMYIAFLITILSYSIIRNDWFVNPVLMGN